ncbi:hypothetical protein [Leucobacter japonicus]|uniref:hypothetical protein n=1 Tax=Leucobacter japonicus TaxID=1461259 RepID=UPI0006A7787C|nr:hypothetical protein [Leucobacter japonicus]
MTEQDNPAGENGGNNAGFTPPATQEELNALIAGRLDRERSKYAGFEELKEKAARLDELEEQNRSELEKAQARAEAAEKALSEKTAAEEAAKAEAEAKAELAKTATAVAEAKGIPVALLRGDSKEALEAHADELAAALGNGPRLNYVPNSGTGAGSQSATNSLAAGRERAKARSSK